MATINGYQFNRTIDSFSLQKHYTEKELKNYLSFIAKNPQFIDEKNIVSIVTCIKDRAFQFLNDQQIKLRVYSIREVVLSLKNRHRRFFVHEFALRGNEQGVKALVRFDYRQANLRCVSKRTALDYAKAQNAIKSHETINYLSLFDRIDGKAPLIHFRDLRHVVCNKGAAYLGLDRAESLFFYMKELGLEIIQRTSYHNAHFYFTKTFSYKRFDDRPLIFCLVEVKGKFYPRLFWLSASQCIWRRADKSFVNWIGKSIREEQGIAAPLRINFVAFDIHYQTQNNQQFKALPHAMGRKFLRHVIDWSDHKVDLNKPTINKKGLSLLRILGGSKDEVTEEGAESFSEGEAYLLGPGFSNLPDNPVENDIKQEYRPNFKKPLTSYTIESPLYGTLTGRILLSTNKAITFLFLEKHHASSAPEVFLAAAEIRGDPITKHGLKKRWVDLGTLSLPLKEYKEQFITKFLSESDRRKSSNGYVSTWRYLRQMPIIKEYCEHILNK